jgi:energy-converting hydrogenase Eha subunit A
MDKLAIALTGLVILAVVITLLPPILKTSKSQRDWFYASLAILAAIVALGAVIYEFMRLP